MADIDLTSTVPIIEFEMRDSIKLLETLIANLEAIERGHAYLAQFAQSITAKCEHQGGENKDIVRVADTC